jgi:hypothetical protein
MVPEETCCGQWQTCSEKKPTLTDAVLGKLDTLIMQSQGFANLIHKVRDVLGIYNPSAWISNSLNRAEESTPTPSEPTISDAARRMTRLIQSNEEAIMDFENLLKNL